MDKIPWLLCDSMASNISILFYTVHNAQHHVKFYSCMKCSKVTDQSKNMKESFTTTLIVTCDGAEAENHANLQQWGIISL